MALTVEDPVGFPLPFGDRFVTVRKVTFDSVYAASGGEALTHEQLGFRGAPDWVEVHPYSVEAGGYGCAYDLTAEELRLFWVDTTTDGAAMAEVAASTDVDAVVVIVKSYGVKVG